MAKNKLNRDAPCLAETLTENREQDIEKMTKEDVGEIISDSKGGRISWKTLVLIWDVNEWTACCWKSGGRSPANLRKWYLWVCKKRRGRESNWRKVCKENGAEKQPGRIQRQNTTNELTFCGTPPLCSKGEGRGCMLDRGPCALPGETGTETLRAVAAAMKGLQSTLFS